MIKLLPTFNLTVYMQNSNLDIGKNTHVRQQYLKWLVTFKPILAQRKTQFYLTCLLIAILWITLY